MITQITTTTTTPSLEDEMNQAYPDQVAEIADRLGTDESTGEATERTRAGKITTLEEPMTDEYAREQEEFEQLDPRIIILGRQMAAAVLCVHTPLSLAGSVEKGSRHDIAGNRFMTDLAAEIAEHCSSIFALEDAVEVLQRTIRRLNGQPYVPDVVFGDEANEGAC